MLAPRRPDSLLSVVQRLRLITSEGVVHQVVGLVVLIVIVVASLRPISGLATLFYHFVMVPVVPPLWMDLLDLQLVHS